jgi:hypothetical protein
VRRRRWLWAVPALILAAALWYNFAGSRTPPGQPPLAAMDLAALKVEFNRAADQTRIIVLLSPT